MRSLPGPEDQIIQSENTDEHSGDERNSNQETIAASLQDFVVHNHPISARASLLHLEYELARTG